MPSLMICCPYTGVFTGERERSPSWIDDPVPPDSEKENGNNSSKGLFLERMSQVAITKIEALQQVTQEALESIFADAEREGELLPLLARIAVPTLLIRADAGLGTLLDDAAWEEARRYLPAARPWRLAARHITYIAASLTSSCRRSSIF